MVRRCTAATLVLVLAAALCAPVAGFAATSTAVSRTAIAAPVAARPSGVVATGRVLVKPKLRMSAAGLRSLGVVGGTAVGTGGLVSAPVPAGVRAADFATQLVRSGSVEYAVPDYVRSVSYSSNPGDPDYVDTATWGTTNAYYRSGKSWWLHGTGSPNFDQVWPDLAVDGAAGHAVATGAQVKVAVIDTGFYMNHPDRASNIVAGKDEFHTYSNTSGYTTGNDVTPASASAPNNDELTAAHGTMTASEIAQGTANGVGGAGAAWDTQVVVYKAAGVWVDGDPANGYPAGSVVLLDGAIIQAIYDATNAGCRVISMSLGGSGSSQAFVDAINYAHSKGVVVVAASGNEDASAVSYPAAYANVIAVGSYGMTGNPATTPGRSPFSNYGAALDIVAPGEVVWGPDRPGYDAGYGAPGYTFWSGTSMATPIVAAAAALTLRLDPTLTPTQVESYLERGAVDMGVTGRDDYTGWGRLDMKRTYDLLLADGRLPGTDKAPVTTCDAVSEYVGPATIHLSASDGDVSPVAVTYLSLDGATPVVGNTVVVPEGTAARLHTLEYWSVDTALRQEARHSVSFTVIPRAQAPVVETMADIATAYTGPATIHLNGIDSGGRETTTYYRLDAGNVAVGVLATVSSAGTHTIEYWSVDALNIEELPHHVATFTVVAPTAAPVARATTSITAARKSLRVPRGRPYGLSGRLNGGRRGDVVIVEVLRPRSSRWAKVATRAATSGTSLYANWSYSGRVSTRGTYVFRARFAGDGARLPSTSARTSIQVR